MRSLYPVNFVVRFCAIVLVCLCFTAPALARRKGDRPSSMNGTAGGCGGGGTCLYFHSNGTASLTGTDSFNNPITVNATFYDWSFTDDAGNHVSQVAIDLVLQGTDTTLNLQRFTMSGVQANAAYLTCENLPETICVNSPEPDPQQDVEEPTPIPGSDGINTQWDFASTAGVDTFRDLQTCNVNVCPIVFTAPELGEAVLVFDGSFAANKISLSTNNYLAIVTDGSGHTFNLGGLSQITPPPLATNNTQATAKVIKTSTLNDVVDTSQLSPSEDANGNMVFPEGFIPPPVPSCNPTGDNRIFRAAWYSFTAPASGAVTVTTFKSHYDTLIYVLDSSLTEMTCQDDPPTGPLLEGSATFDVFDSRTYYIVVVQSPPVSPYPLSTDGDLFLNFTFAPAVAATMISPTPGSTLSSSTATFTWTAGTQVSQYNLYVGSAPGLHDIAYVAAGTNTSATVTTLPTNGSPFYVTLYSLIHGFYQKNAYTYVATGGTPTAATMISPASGSTLTGSSATFSWTTGWGATQYSLYLGTAPLKHDIAFVNAGLNTSATVTSIPTNGATMYVTLYSLIGGSYQSHAYTYIEKGTPAPATITAPTPGSKLTGTTATFTWTTGTGVSFYTLYVGTTAGAHDIAFVNAGTSTSATVSNIPAHGGTFYVTLYSYIDGAYQSRAYTYIESGTAAKATMTSPANGSTITGNSATFTWTSGTGVTSYSVYIGTSLGAHDLDYVATSSTTATVINLPANGKTVYVRLYSLIAGAWQSADYSYSNP